jgi:hypothetical protein
MLFGGNNGQFEVFYGQRRVCLDSWIELQVAPRTAVVFKRLRSALDSLLVKKINDPSIDITDETSAVGKVGRLAVDVLTASERDRGMKTAA